MQLSRYIVVLIAAVFPAIGNAAECNEKDAVPFPEKALADFNKIDRAFLQINRKLKGLENSNEPPKHRKRQVEEQPLWPPIDCKGNEICTSVLRIPTCYDEETTNMRWNESMIITLKNGDIMYPNNIKGNVFTNQGPIMDQILRGMEKRIEILPTQFREARKSALAEASARRNSMAATTAGSTPGTSAISSSITAAPTAPSASANSATGSASQPSSSENADSMAAGRMVIGGGWFAAAIVVLGGAAVL